MNKLFLYITIFVAVALSLVKASGTFVFPPTPKINHVVDSALLSRGQNLFKKVFNSKLSCYNCHGKQSKFKFRRRKLSKVINKLASQVEKCSTMTDRLGLSESVAVDPRDLEAMQIYMAKQWKLLDYLRK